MRQLNILIIGLGGVGSFAAEFLARAGVGHMTIVDGGDANTDFNGECNYVPACHSLLGSCKPYSYRRAEWEQYTPNACSCADHPVAADCNAARGCQWNGSACAVVTAADCSAFNTRNTCQTHMDDCLWDEYANVCKENPRGQAYICSESTFGVTAFGDPSDQWVRTLDLLNPYASVAYGYDSNLFRVDDAVPTADQSARR